MFYFFLATELVISGRLQLLLIAFFMKCVFRIEWFACSVRDMRRQVTYNFAVS